MPEDQLTALPPEVRQMVMTGTTAMMNGAAANPGMMAPGVMMDMSGMMGPMGMGMGMGGDMGMGGGMMQVDGRGMMPDSAQVQQGGVGVGNGTPEQVGANVGMMQDGYNGGAGQASMMNMGIGGGDFGIQVCLTFILYSTSFIQVHSSGSRCDKPTNVPCYGSPSCCSTGT